MPVLGTLHEEVARARLRASPVARGAALAGATTRTPWGAGALLAEPPAACPQAGWPSDAGPANGGGGEAARVLVPYNGTPVADAALRAASDLGRGGPVSVWVLYVRPWDVVARAGMRQCLVTLHEARTCALLAVTELRRRAVPASAVVRDAPRERVGHAIAAEAERLDVACIVLGTHGHGALLSTFLGSVSRMVARRTTRPIVRVQAS